MAKALDVPSHINLRDAGWKPKRLGPWNWGWQKKGWCMTAKAARGLEEVCRRRDGGIPFRDGLTSAEVTQLRREIENANGENGNG